MVLSKKKGLTANSASGATQTTNQPTYGGGSWSESVLQNETVNRTRNNALQLLRNANITTGTLAPLAQPAPPNWATKIAGGTQAKRTKFLFNGNSLNPL